MSWNKLPIMSLDKLFEYKTLFTLIGAYGTGKTTLQSYLTDWLLVHDEKAIVFWLQPKNVLPYYLEELNKVLPEKFRGRIVVTSNLNDDLIWYDDKDKTNEELEEWLALQKLLCGDESGRFADRYSNAQEYTRAFGALLGSLRHKSMTGIVADQGNDFIVAAKEKSTLFIFTSLTDFVARKLQESGTDTIQRWINWNAYKLAQLTDFNRKKLKTEGWGLALVTNGTQTYLLPFKRPSWYSINLSTILRYLRPSDVFAREEEEEKSSFFNIKSVFIQCLLFADHVRRYAKLNPTPENMSHLFLMASPLFYDGKRRSLDNARALSKLPAYLCNTEDCPFCNNPEMFLEKLRELKNKRIFERPKTTLKQEQEISSLVGELIV